VFPALPIGSNPRYPNHMEGQDLALVLRRLAQFDAAGKIAAAETVADNTRNAFKQDWKTWVEFCAAAEVPPESVSSGLLAAFVRWLAQGDREGNRAPAAPATIARRLTGVLVGLRSRGLAAPRGISSDARKLLNSYTRELEREGLVAGRGKSPALLIRQLREICSGLPPTNAGTRDRALITIGFGIAARRSELARLTISDVKVEARGLEVCVRASKTGSRTVAIRASTHEATDPRRAWLAWCDLLGSLDGPAFRRVTRHDRILNSGLSPAAIGAILTRRAESNSVYGVTGHSLRSGLATEARRAGHPPEQIARQGGWKDNSAVLYGYMQTVDRWTDNVTEGLL
jgi:integrase